YGRKHDMSQPAFERQHIHDLAELSEEFSARVNQIVWCIAASVDPLDQRPRTRVLHPIWEGATGWISTHRQSTKSKHLAACPYLSLAYCADARTPVYVDCKAEFMDDLPTKERTWNLALNTPEPVGYDPALDFISYDNPTYGVLKLTPWRIEVYTL